ncbi:MAG TPA: response regulator transcription factor [Ktedonobacteraceae bacterium]|nr:response regulator transcription factor [Ktedonobacteraceae bacterium]
MLASRKRGRVRRKNSGHPCEDSRPGDGRKRAEKAMRVLVVEDHPELGPDLKTGLEEYHYAVDLVTNGEDALTLASLVPYDLLILDILLPELDGWEVCRRLRAQRKRMPILFLTALGEVDHRVQGLDLGADDYLVKPFAFRELEARVRALLRRDAADRSPVLQFLDLTLDTRTHEGKRGERPFSLSNKEYALLHLLMSRPREILSRTTIAEHLWNLDADHFSNVIDVYVRNLRRALCAAGESDLIQTVRGAGYQLKEPVS